MPMLIGAQCTPTGDARTGLRQALASMSPQTILIVDDDADVRRLLRRLVERGGHRALEARDGREALSALQRDRPDLVVLDVTMPLLDGWQTLEWIREVSDVPVLMLTAQGDELDRVRGLRAGADDYVAKPFGRAELMARVDALLRRAAAAQPLIESYRDHRLQIDFYGREVTTADGDRIELTPIEYRLLVALVRNRGQVLSHEQALERVWGDAATRSTNQVKLYIGYLRRKLERAGIEPDPIESVRGFGYRYRAPD
jgi:DNA-binding response OmpR family regulator